MVIAALVIFGALLVAWVFAPDGRSSAKAATTTDAVPVTA